MTMRDESNSAALPLANLWLDLIVGRLLNSASDRRRVWIVVDELPVLGRQAKLETLVTRGRKRGLAAVLGFQSIAQLRRIYGHEQAAVLASMPSTKLLLRVDEPETAAFIARQIGERETLREEIGISTAEHGNRYNIHPARRTEPVVMAVGGPAAAEAGRLSLHRRTRSRPRQSEALRSAQAAGRVHSARSSETGQP